MLLFVAGVVINAFGVALITKSNLGTSQISSVPYVLSLQYPAVSFGVTTFVMNLAFIVMQMILLRGQFKPSQFMQVVVNVIFSGMLEVGMLMLSFLNPTQLWERLVCVVVGCIVLGFGISLEVAPNLVMVPGEGAVYALSIVTKAKYGTAKIIFDLALIIIAVALSFVFFGRLNGVGLGTIVSALVVGTFINFFNRHLKFLDRIRALALGRD